VSALNLEDIRTAHQRIAGDIHRTPVLTSRRLDEFCGAQLFFKCENLQKTGSFKARGALNAVRSLDPAGLRAGVVTHSSGNHAAAVSWAAALRGAAATVVMPRTTSAFKQAAVLRYGGRIVLCEPTHRAREETAERIRAETGAQLVHPFNDLRVMAGQGTVALELLGDVPGLDAVVCPCGGGGLLASTAIVAKTLFPAIRVLAGEPAGAADTLQSLAAGTRQPVAQPASIADGLLAFVGDLTFPEIQRRVDRVEPVSEAEIIGAMRQLLEVMKIAVEPSGGVGFAAVAGRRLGLEGRRVGIILSGGNVDLDAVAWKA
jgi:threonine dehydratase